MTGFAVSRAAHYVFARDVRDSVTTRNFPWFAWILPLGVCHVGFFGLRDSVTGAARPTRRSCDVADRTMMFSCGLPRPLPTMGMWNPSRTTRPACCRPRPNAVPATHPNGPYGSACSPRRFRMRRAHRTGPMAHPQSVGAEATGSPRLRTDGSPATPVVRARFGGAARFSSLMRTWCGRG